MTKGIATLSINLETRLADMQAGFDRAARLAEKNASDVEARFNKLASVAASVGAAIAGAFSVTLVTQSFRSIVNGLDALNDAADATGASIENLSALEDIAARTGTSFDTVSSALVRFNAELAGAKEGSQTAEILKRIGLSAEELRRLDPAEALRRTAAALATFGEDGDKARAVQQLFGKSVAEVAPLLKDLAAAGELNATVTREQAEQAERFNRQLTEFNKNISDAGRAVTSDLLPALNRTLEGFTALSQLRLLNFSSVVEVLKGNTFRDPAEGAAFYASKLAELQQQFRDVVAATDSGKRPGGGKLLDLAKDIEQIQALRDYYRQFAQKELPQASYSNEGRPRFFGGLPEPPGKPPSAKPTDFAGTPLDPLTAAAIKRLQETDTAKLGALQLELQGLLEVGGDSETGAQGEALRKLREEIAKLDPEQQKLAANRQRLNELLASTPSGQLGGVLSDIQLINGAFDDGRITVEQWAELVRTTTARLPKDTEKALDELSAFTKQFQSNVQNVLGDNIASVLRGDFDSIEDAWKNMLINMIAQATAADLATRLFGKDGRGGYLGDLSKLLGGLFADGGVFSQGQSITAFADGGVLNRPTFFGMSGNRMGVAGEAGPEAVLPLKRGSDGKLGVAGGGGGITNIYHVAAGVSRGELISALQLSSQQTEARIMSRLSARRVV